MIDLSVNSCGLKLKNPLIAAAGPITILRWLKNLHRAVLLQL